MHRHKGSPLAGVGADTAEAFLGRFESNISEGDGLKRIGPGAYRVERLPPQSLIFVLQDSCSASSAEQLDRDFLRLDGAVLVGSNSGGYFSPGDQTYFTCPASGISFGIGDKIFGTMDQGPKEYRGIAPDLFAPPAEAVFDVEAFVKRYGIATIKAALAAERK